MRFILLASLLFQSLAADAFKPDCVVKKAVIDDIEMAYYVRGSGKPLVMIIGYKDTMAMWDPALLEELEKNYQLILFDNRGAGLSTDTPANETTIFKMAEDTAKLIEALKLPKVYVLGWSMGARIAQQLAIHHPDLVEKMILCAASAGGYNRKAAAREVIDQMNKPNLAESDKLALIFPDSEVGKAAANGYLERLKNNLSKEKIPNDFAVSTETILRQSKARILWDENQENYDALPSIKIPTLVADGKEDIINPPENAAILASRIPFAWLAFFQGGHAFLFQNHERFSELVKLFLND